MSTETLLHLTTSLQRILALALVAVIVVVSLDAAHHIPRNTRLHTPLATHATVCTTSDAVNEDVLVLSAQDIINIKKVVTTEVVARLKGQNFRNQTDAVVDTILNRVKSGHWGTTVKDVVNAKNQFSAIAGPRSLKPYGNVDRMPEEAINAKVSSEVDRWLKLRADGTPSIIGDNLNYLNPLYSSKRSLRRWGRTVVTQAKKSGLVMGSGKAKHYHGTAADLMKYRPVKFRVVLPD